MALRAGRSRLPYWRHRRHKTQREIADYLGVSQPYISKIKHNLEKLSYEMAANLADFLNVDMMDLYEWIRVTNR